MGSRYIKNFHTCTHPTTPFIITETITECLTDDCRDCRGYYEGVDGLKLKILCQCSCGHTHAVKKASKGKDTKIW